MYIMYSVEVLEILSQLQSFKSEWWVNNLQLALNLHNINRNFICIIHSSTNRKSTLLQNCSVTTPYGWLLLIYSTKVDQMDIPWHFRFCQNPYYNCSSHTLFRKNEKSYWPAWEMNPRPLDWPSDALPSGKRTHDLRISTPIFHSFKRVCVMNNYLL